MEYHNISEENLYTHCLTTWKKYGSIYHIRFLHWDFYYDSGMILELDDTLAHLSNRIKK